MLIGETTVCGKPIASLWPSSEYRVHLRCDTCGKETQTTFANWYKVQKPRGFDNVTSCRTCACRRSAESRRGRPAWNKGQLSKQPREKHPSWKGGTYVDFSGYRMVYTEKGRREDGVGWNSYRKEHALVVEEQLGRRLLPEEKVHHIDGQKLNNILSNLFVTSNAGHRDAHQSLQVIGYLLVQAGLITFDTTIGKYVAHVKLRELLEHPAEGNQQPSLWGDPVEGSETTGESH